MNSPTPEEATEKSLSAKRLAGSEVQNLVEQESGRRAQTLQTKMEVDAERIRSSIARLTSNSIDELQGLTSELQELQRFLNSEVQRVQGEIESALAGIKIIIDTISPWKSNPVSLATPTSARSVRAGPGSKY